MAKNKSVAVVIVNYNTQELTQSAISDLAGIDVYVVDNGSSEKGLAQALANRPLVTYWPLPKNIGFGPGNNYAIGKIYRQYEYLLLLNSDARITATAINTLVAKAKKTKADIASCYLTYPNGRFQPNAGSYPSLGNIFTWISGLDDVGNLLGIHLNSYQESKPWYYSADREVGWVSGSVMLVNSAIFAKIGFFDEAIFMYGEDVDLCVRAKKARAKIMWFKTPQAVHIGGASSADAKYRQWLGEFLGIAYLFKKHYGRLGFWYIKLLLYIFVPIRIVLFYIFGKKKYAYDYLKIIKRL